MRAGAGGPARGRRAAAARLLADRHHLHGAGRQRPAGPRRASRRPPRPRPAALRHAAGAPAHTQRAAPCARPPAGTDTRDTGLSARLDPHADPGGARFLARRQRGRGRGWAEALGLGGAEPGLGLRAPPRGAG